MDLRVRNKKFLVEQALVDFGFLKTFSLAVKHGGIKSIAC